MEITRCSRATCALAWIVFLAAAAPIASARVTLHVMFKADPDNVRVAKARIKAFEAAYPSISVVPQYNDSGQTPNQRLLVELAAGVAPDVAAIDLEPVELALRGLLMPLDAFVKGDKAFAAQNWLHKRQLSEFTYGGRLYAIPEGLSPYPMYYNANLLQQAGIPLPPTGLSGADFEAWTYERFLDVCKKLTRDTNGDGRPEYFGFNAWGVYHPDGFTPWLWMSGADLFRTDPKTGLATQSALDEPKAIDALQWYADLKNRQRVVGGDFNSGRAGFSYGGRWMVPTLRAAKLKFTWDVAPIPHPAGHDSNHLALLRPRGAILASTKHPKEAWAFLRFIAAPEQEQVTWDAAAVFTIPVYKNSVIRDRFLSDAPPRNNQLFMDIGTDDSSRCSWDNKVPRRWAEIIAAMALDLGRVWDNKATAAQVCGPLAKKIDGILKR